MACWAMRFFSHASSMASSPKKVLVPVANRTEPLEAVVTIHVLQRAGAEAEVTVASAKEQLRVDPCHSVKIISDASIYDCTNVAFDLVSLPVCTQCASPASLR